MTADLRILILPLALVAAAGGTRLSAQNPPPAPEESVVVAPVEIDGDVLFSVRGTSSYPAAERAAAIRQRIIAAAADPAVTPATVVAVDREGVIRIVAGERLLTTV